MTDTNPIAEYLKEGLMLEGLVSYQDGSVVSRTVINKPVGTITLFAFAPRTRWEIFPIGRQRRQPSPSRLLFIHIIIFPARRPTTRLF